MLRGDLLCHGDLCDDFDLEYRYMITISYKSFVIPPSKQSHHPTSIPSKKITSTAQHMMNTQRKVYDAMIIGGGPAGLSTALGLSRIARSTIVFDSGEYRNQGSTAMHTYLTRDGIHPSDFRAMARQEIQSKYSAYSTFSESKIVGVKNTEILPGYIGFEAIDNANKIYLSRKLVLASGSEDILPTNIQGYKENWAKHM